MTEGSTGLSSTNLNWFCPCKVWVSNGGETDSTLYVCSSLFSNLISSPASTDHANLYCGQVVSIGSKLPGKNVFTLAE